GSFSKYSYEFQTLSEAGEDIIYIDEKNKIAINKEDFSDEIINDFNLEIDKNNLVEKKSIEVGDIYSLGFKYSEAFDLKYKSKEGKDELVYMGSYGMSPSRLMGAIVELNNDDKGIIWPEAVAPFRIHLISLGQNKEVDKIYKNLEKSNIEVLYDDREDVSVGKKFADADLIGCPVRLVVSKKTLESKSVEFKKRSESEVKLVKIDKIEAILK
ncbi:prolyl-tRNA synthetase, partial [bacterium]|nr:prolyl-tRNA synthetase [bacterium]